MAGVTARLSRCPHRCVCVEREGSWTAASAVCRLLPLGSHPSWQGAVPRLQLQLFSSKIQPALGLLFGSERKEGDGGSDTPGCKSHFCLLLTVSPWLVTLHWGLSFLTAKQGVISVPVSGGVFMIP